MEESQKQETDSLGSGCSCDYKVSGFQKVLPESKSNCLALGWDLERGVPVAGRVASRGAVPRGVRRVSGATAPLWVLEGLLGLRWGAHPVSVFSFPFGLSPRFSLPSPVTPCPRLHPHRPVFAVSWLPAHTPSPLLPASASGLCLSAAPCLLCSISALSLSPHSPSVPPPQGFPETFSWHCESVIVPLHFDKP